MCCYIIWRKKICGRRCLARSRKTVQPTLFEVLEEFISKVANTWLFIRNQIAMKSSTYEAPWKEFEKYQSFCYNLPGDAAINIIHSARIFSFGGQSEIWYIACKYPLFQVSGAYLTWKVMKSFYPDDSGNSDQPIRTLKTLSLSGKKCFVLVRLSIRRSGVYITDFPLAIFCWFPHLGQKHVTRSIFTKKIITVSTYLLLHSRYDDKILT